jgi:hypothetical protein
MAARILPQEVTEHLEAAIQLSNRHVHLRFLDEADALLTLDLPTAAVMVAGVVLESILAGMGETGAIEDRQRMEKWLELRHTVAHAHRPCVSLEQAREMVGDVRKSLLLENTTVLRLALPAKPPTLPRQVRGKYKYVATSSADFIRRKADELRLETQ